MASWVYTPSEAQSESPWPLASKRNRVVADRRPTLTRPLPRMARLASPWQEDYQRPEAGHPTNRPRS